MAQIGKVLLVFGLGVAAFGLVLWGVSTLAPGLRLGRLPGDIVIDQGNAKVFIPITTMLLVSLVVTVVFWIIAAVRR